MQEDIFKAAFFETSDLNISIKNFARSSKLLLSELDFDIEKIITAAVDDKAGGTITHSCINKETFPEGYLDNSSIKLKQTFEIKFKPYEKNSIDIQLNPNADYTQILVTLKKGFKCKSTEESKNLLYAEINKKLALEHIIIYFFEGDLKNQINSFVDELGTTKSTEDSIFLAACSYGYKASKDDSINIVYAKINTESKADMYDQDVMKETKPGTLLIEYFKPIIGTSGRDCHGNFIEATKPNSIFAPKFKIDDSINVVEDEETIRYYANKNGYIEHTEHSLKVSDSIKIKSINAKDTGSIKAKHSADLKINVSEENPTLDAIGPSMTVKVSHLAVKGSVAEKATIFADEVNIEGMTHSSSKIECSTQAKIKHHRGSLKTQFADIENLEGGLVTADIVNIQNAKSGTITAKKVFIERLESNCKITATELIQINEVCGEGNDLYITSCAHEETNPQMNTLTNQIKDIKTTLQKDSQELKKLMQVISAGRETIDKIKAVNQPDNKAHQDIIKRFKSVISRAKSLKENVDILKEKLTNLEKDIVKSRGGVFDAKILIGSECKGKQTIRFRAPDGQDYFFCQQSSSAFLSISIYTDTDGSYYVKDMF